MAQQVSDISIKNEYELMKFDDDIDLNIFNALISTNQDSDVPDYIDLTKLSVEPEEMCTTPFTKIEKNDILNDEEASALGDSKLSLSTGKPRKEPDRKYPCSLCLMKFTKSEYLQIHLQCHDPLKTCGICNITIGSKRMLGIHLNKHIKEKMDVDRKLLKHCDICEKDFTTPKGLKGHMRIHTNERPFECKTCGKGFKQSGALNTHVKIHLGVNKYPCKICNGTFSLPSSVRRHVKKIHETGKSFECRPCNMKYFNKDSLIAHKKEKHPCSSHPCSYCGKLLPNVNLYRKHASMYHNLQRKYMATNVLTNPYLKCALCGEISSNRRSYFDHRNRHLQYNKSDLQEALKIGSYHCKLCTREFKSRNALCAHMASHMEKTHRCDTCQENYTYSGFNIHNARAHLVVHCSVCKKPFEGQQRLRRHFGSCHPTVNRRFFCDRCSKRYATKPNLKFHIQTVHEKNNLDINKYQCELCAKVFLTRWMLGTHISRVHPTNIHSKCEICHKTFKRYFLLKQHMMSKHSEIEYHFCPVCKKGFKDTLLLKKHHNSAHVHVKKFQCQICFKEFNSKGSHRYHLENKVCLKFLKKLKKNNDPSLNGVDIIECNLCQRLFSTQAALSIHMVFHYVSCRKCRVCGLKYGSTRSVRNHMKNVHPGEKMFRCIYCDVTFDRYKDIRKHFYLPEHKEKVTFKTEEILNESCEPTGSDIVDIKSEILDIKCEELDLE